MTEYDLTAKSRPVIITDYQSRWVTEFEQMGRRIRTLVGKAATRIDHIGSTSVPGLAAKDVIDIQITVEDLDSAQEVTRPLKLTAFRQGDEVVFDEFRAMDPRDRALRKLYMREPEGERRVHIHIRQSGLFNQTYALLFRDYLRANQSMRNEYEVVKRRAATIFPECIDGYLYLKDPVFHIIYEAALFWAQTVGWSPDEDYS